MGLSLLAPSEQVADVPEQLPWIRLVGLCCQAAGGDEGITHRVAGAWGVLYAAAHLLDSIQDEDDPDPWWASLGAGAAINITTGLIFTAMQLLNSLHEDKIPQELAQRVTQDFNRTLLYMCSGQHSDLARVDDSLEGRWQIAEAKSGAFFSLACRAGATLAGVDDRCISHYSTFGQALGMMIQLCDDFRDLQQDAQKYLSSDSKGTRSLPIAFFMDVATSDDRKRLRSIVRDPRPSSEFVDLIEGSGARLYLVVKSIQLRAKAHRSLERAGALLPARSKLDNLLAWVTIVQ